ncbi:hypothetical protein ACLF6K_36250 [Streptomyces xanthophaeus]
MVSPATAAPTRSGIGRIVGASLVGTTIEWYDNSSDQGCHLRLLGKQDA